MSRFTADHDLLPALDALGRPRLLVVGDLILDRYAFGNAERVSPEAPVILLCTDARESRLGGAANVCHMLRGLEAEVVCAGVTGDDLAGQELRTALAETGCEISAVLVDSSRPTTVKERFIGRAANRHPHQMLRVDSETRQPLTVDMERALWQRLAAEIPRCQSVLISDYGKGVCTPWLLDQVIRAARQAGTPVLVDPIRGTDYSRYCGATTMTPNRSEAELATGLRIERPVDAFRAGSQLCRGLDMPLAIVTLDRDGMALVGPDGSGELFPTRARAVYDITGAGDMVLATIGVAWAAGLPPATACRLANVAAGLEVEKVGVAIVPRDEIRQQLLQQGPAAGNKLVSLAELDERLQALRRQGCRIVLAHGCFDLLHVGHLSCLEEAAAQGDVLVVAINGDASVRRLKGPDRPLLTQADRAAMLAALSVVDFVTVFDQDTPHALLERLRPDVLVQGGAHSADEMMGHDVVSGYGGRIHMARSVEGVSTSAMLASLRNSSSARAAAPQPHVAAPLVSGAWPAHIDTSSLDY